MRGNAKAGGRGEPGGDGRGCSQWVEGHMQGLCLAEESAEAELEVSADGL